MIQLMLLRKGKTYELPATNITWSGQKLAAPRTIQATIFSTLNGLQHKTPISEGDRLVLLDGNVELFRGIIERKVNSSQATLEVVAYDSLYYLTRSRDTYNFKNKSLSDVVRQLCKDFSIPVGTIANVDTKMTRIFEGQTLFDMILTYINLTFKKTGVRYTIYDKQGKICLAKVVDRSVKWVVEEGVNLTNYRYTRTIADTATRVKLQGKITQETKKTKTQPAKKTTKTIIARVESPELQKQFGVLQYFENVSEETNSAKLLAQAKQMIKDKGEVGESFELEALGITDIVSGSAVYVIVPDLAVRRGFYVDSDVHTFVGGTHNMSLTLTKTNEMPEVDASSKEESEESKEKKASSKKKSKTKSKNKKKKSSAKKDTFYDDLIADLTK